MFPDEMYVAERIMFQRVEERVEEARARSLARQAAGRQEGLLSRWGSRLMCRLSRPLMALDWLPAKPLLSACDGG